MFLWLLIHRCRSKQIFGGAKDFFPNIPKLALKVYVRLLPTNFLPQRSWGRFLVRSRKKGSSFILCKRWAPFFEVKQSWAPFLPRYLGISSDFAQIFDKSKLLRVSLYLVFYTTVDNATKTIEWCICSNFSATCRWGLDGCINSYKLRYLGSFVPQCTDMPYKLTSRAGSGLQAVVWWPFHDSKILSGFRSLKLISWWGC